MTKTVVLYFDDHPDDLAKYSKLIEKKLEASVVALPPPHDLSLEGVPDRADLILIDYELTQKHGELPPAPYQGGTLASRVSENYRESPVVLLSRPSIFRKLRVSSDQLSTVDDWFFKEELVKNKNLWVRLHAITEGFATIRSAKKRDWGALRGLLRAEEDELVLLSEAKPLIPRVGEGGVHWDAHQIASWIRKTLLAFPGILYDSNYAAASLGISLESWTNGKIQALFAPAKYAGVFRDESDRWWRGRLFRIAQGVMAGAGLDGPITLKFQEALKAKTGLNVEPSICVFSGERHADTVCYVLGKPVMRKYSLEYLPDNRPSFMEAARVSFKAIRESNDFHLELLPPASRALVKEIRK